MNKVDYKSIYIEISCVLWNDTMVMYKFATQEVLNTVTLALQTAGLLQVSTPLTAIVIIVNLLGHFGHDKKHSMDSHQSEVF